MHLHADMHFRWTQVTVLSFLLFQEALEIADLCLYLKALLNFAWEGFLLGFSMFSLPIMFK